MEVTPVKKNTVAPFSPEDVDSMIAGVVDATQAERLDARALPAEDGVDYRRRVLSRLTGRTRQAAKVTDPELWKRANARLDQLGL